jgi:hypothetical protein
MTPGEQALHDAMRLELASIYSQRQIEHRAANDMPAIREPRGATVHDLAEARKTRRTA